MSHPAPDRLELIRDFVNTLDVDTEEPEGLPTPDALVAWLAERGLAGDDLRATRADLTRAVELREALRELLLANHGDYDADPAAAVTVDAAAQRSGVGLRFAPDGVARVAPAKAGVDGALGELLAVVAEAQREGTWSRLKVCPADDCRWAFYDRSRNRSAVWCSMAVCGNRAKVRGYRERHGGPS